MGFAAAWEAYFRVTSTREERTPLGRALEMDIDDGNCCRKTGSSHRDVLTHLSLQCSVVVSVGCPHLGPCTNAPAVLVSDSSMLYLF